MKNILLLFLLNFSFTTAPPSFSCPQSLDSGFFEYVGEATGVKENIHSSAPVPMTDTSNQSFIKIYQLANQANMINNLPIALNLYNQFVIQCLSRNLEKRFWKELRSSYSQMGSISASLSDFDQANHYLKKALDITLEYKPNDLSNTFYFLFKIGECFYSLFDFNNAFEYYRQAEVLLPADFYLPNNKKAWLFNGLALCYYKFGLDLESEKYLNKSIEIEKSIGNPKDLAAFYDNISLVFQKKNEYSKALLFLTKSLNLNDSLNQPVKSAFVINNIGNLYLEKESYDSAKIFYQRSLSIRRATVNVSDQDKIVSYNNYSYVSYMLGNLDTARFYNNLAINLNTQKIGEEKIKDGFSITDYLISISDRIDINKKRYVLEMNEEYLSESFNLFYPTVQLIIDQLIKYNSAVSSNIFLNEYKRFFDSSIISAYSLDSLMPSKCPRTLVISETFKSLSLLNINSERRNLQADSIVYPEINLRNQYYQFQQKLSVNEGHHSNLPAFSSVEAVNNHMAGMYPFDSVSITTIKNDLDAYFQYLSDTLISYSNKIKNRLILDYYFFDSLLIIHAITKSNIISTLIKPNKEFTSALTNYPKSIKSIEPVSIAKHRQILASYLLSPYARTLELYANIVIVPDQNLAGIPFESLPNLPITSKFNQYLVETKNISYRFSVLNRNYSNLIPEKKYSIDFLGIAPFAPNDTSNHNLPGSAREIKDLAKIFMGNKYNVDFIAGHNATYRNFISRNFDTRILHLSTHSYINNVNSQLSFLELFPASDPLYLFLPVMSSIPFHNELLFLNACETGSNLIDPSTGFVSFIRTMANINVQNYIGTLWKIYDDPSYHFTLTFYDNVLKGCSYSEALTLAKRKFIQSNQYYYPLFWSPFILYEND